MIVYILHIKHSDGDAYWAFSDEEKAKDRLLAWAREWWPIELGGEIPDGLSDGNIVLDYFERMKGDEYWNIDDVTLDAA